MLDDLNQLNQFGVEIAWRRLQGIFKSDFLANTPDFSGLKVVFYGKQPSLGLKIGLEWASDRDFHWEQSSESKIIIDDETYPLPEVSELSDWHDLLLVMKIAGVDLYDNLQELKTIINQLAPSVPTVDNQAKQLALYLAGKISLVFSPEQTRGVGEFWRRCLESQAHNLCFNQTITDLNFAGWSSHPVEKPFGVLDLIPTEIDRATDMAFAHKNRQLSGKMPASRQLQLHTDNPTNQLLEMMLLAETTSFYLACLNKQSLKTLN